MESNFTYVYILKSTTDPSRHYTGITHDLKKRLSKHNKGDCPHTVKYKPWHIDTAIAFSEKQKAIDFERYLKSHSGRAFAAKHF